MATYTAGDLINRALRLLGVLAEGEVPSASMANDALMAFDQMIDSWSTESLSVYTLIDQTFIWPPGQATATLGPESITPPFTDFVGLRPVLLDDATYFVYQGVSYPIQIVNNAQYNSIPVKSISSPVPVVLNTTMSYPAMTMTLYPIPTVPLEFHFFGPIFLDQPVTLDTVIAFPPGYNKAFVYNLALELAPEFGAEPAKDVRDGAKASKRNIKRINAPNDVLDTPAALLSNKNFNGLYNLYTGN